MGASASGGVLSIAGQTAGDTIYFNGTSWVRLAKGTANQRLSMNAGATAPEWQTVATGVTITGQRVTATSAFTTTSGTFVDITGLSFTADNNGGSSYAVFTIANSNNGANTNFVTLVDNATTLNGKTGANTTAGMIHNTPYPIFVANDGQVVKAQARCSAGTFTGYSTASGTDYPSSVEVLEIV